MTEFGPLGVRMVHAPSRAAAELSPDLDLAPILLLNMAVLLVLGPTQVHKPATLKSASVSKARSIRHFCDVTDDYTEEENKRK